MSEQGDNDVRYEHIVALFMWKVLAHHEAVWSKLDGLGFSDYYYVQHKIFKRMKRIKCFGYRPKDHPKYKELCNKYLIKENK